MIRSMTGFGSASAEAEGCRFAVEVKSVNNRFFKAVVRVPEELSTLETEIETAVAKRLARGSVMVLVRFVPGGAVAAAEVAAKGLTVIFHGRGAAGGPSATSSKL